MMNFKKLRRKVTQLLAGKTEETPKLPSKPPPNPSTTQNKIKLERRWQLPYSYWIIIDSQPEENEANKK